MASEKLSYEIAALYTGNAAIKQAFDDFAKLNAEGAKVVNGLKKLGNEAGRTGEAIRGSRAAFSQFGMQINQFGTQIASGTSLGMAFAQQIGDVGWALSQTDGKLGKLGAFLAGPWGAAIAIAANALYPLIENLFSVSDATKQNEEAAKDLDSAIAARRSSEDDLRLALAKTAGEYLRIRKEMQANAKVAVQTALVELNARLAVLNGLKAEQAKLNAELKGAGGMRAQAEMGTGQMAARYRVAKDTEKAIVSVQAQTAILERLTAKLNASTVNVISASSAATRESSKHAASTERAGKSAKDTTESQQNAYDKLAERLRSIVNIRTADTDEIGRAKNELESFNKLIDELTVSTVNGKPVGAQLLGEFATQINAVRSELVAATLDTQEYMVAIPEMSKQAEEAWKAQRTAIENVGMAVNDAFKGMITAGMSWKDGMKSIINAVINELWRLFVVQQIVGMVTKAVGGVLGGGGLAASDPLAMAFDASFGKRAGGGSITANQPYLVGEKGPELVIPGSSGTVIPNNKTMSAMGGGAMVINVDARGSADPAAVRAQVQQGILEAAPSIIAAAQNQTITTLRRPKLGGVMQ